MNALTPSLEPFGITRQEMRILHLLCAGKVNKQIAAELCISIETVKRHLTHLYEKVGVTDRLEAAMFAVAKGLVSVDNTSQYAHREALLIEIEECHRKIEKYVGRSRMLVQKLANPADEAD